VVAHLVALVAERTGFAAEQVPAPRA
jgi:hypothetical protein